jgi:hypothetical protein
LGESRGFRDFEKCSVPSFSALAGAVAQFPVIVADLSGADFIFAVGV